MYETLYALSLWELALTLFAAFLLLAAVIDGLLALVQPTRVGKAATGLVNNAHLLTATLTALVLTFLASSVWSDASEARNAVRAEARALRQAVELSGGLPGPARDSFHAAARDYVQAVVTEEWPAMMAGHSGSFARTERMRMVTVIARAEAEEARPSSLYRWMMDATAQLDEARAKRLDLAQNAITPVKWLVTLVLVTVTMTTIGFCHIDRRGARRILLTLYAVAVSAMVFLIYAHDRPFAGEIMVDPAPLQRALQPAGV